MLPYSWAAVLGKITDFGRGTSKNFGLARRRGGLGSQILGLGGTLEKIHETYQNSDAVGLEKIPSFSPTSS